jgi:hypothetical protein
MAKKVKDSEEFDWRKVQREEEENDPDYDEDDKYDDDDTPATQTLIDELGFDPDELFKTKKKKSKSKKI